jgi:type II secretory pathway pseudopilin PulG
MQKKQKTAFSLIELSVIILIIGIIIGSSVGISKTAINSSETKITKDRMDTIYKALSNFVATNRRLPCPSVLTLAKGTAGYGAEAATPGTCTGISANGNTIYGMIPITALGLDPDMGEDGFGTKFSYVADKRFTKQSLNDLSSDGFEITKAVVAEDGVAISPTLIKVQGPAGTDVLPDFNALFVLISHGANKDNGWDATGTTQNPAGSIANETSNSSLDSVSTYIAYSTDPNFDDVLLFKNKPQLVRDAGLEFIICNAAEAQTTTKTWTKNGLYGCSICSTVDNNNKTCGRYGVWSSLSTESCVANTSSCAPYKIL